MNNRYPLGGVARLFLDLISGSTGATGQEPYVAIRRRADGKWFETSTGLWHTTIVENLMTERDSINEPGHYYFDFDQATDLEPGSRAYMCRFRNLGTPTHLSYQEIEFGPLGAAAELELCAITGALRSSQGKAVPNAVVEAQVVPVYVDAAGRGVETQLVRTYSNDLGEFSLSLVRGITAVLEIPAIGYKRKVVVPDLPTVSFTNL